MTFLIDTNVISEVRKGRRCDPQVARWYQSLTDDDLYLSVLVIGEIKQGIERVFPRDPQKARALSRWFEDIKSAFEGHILPIDHAVAETWGRMNAPNRLPVIDGLLAATAEVNGLILATRNVTDIESCGVRYCNPFEPV